MSLVGLAARPIPLQGRVREMLAYTKVLRSNTYDDGSGGACNAFNKLKFANYKDQYPKVSYC